MAKMFGYQLSGIKSMIDRVNSFGLEGLIDHRRNLQLPEETQEPEITVQNRLVTVDLPGPVTLLIKEDDLLARKIIGTALAEEGVISVTQGAQILGYTPPGLWSAFKALPGKGKCRSAG
ncbi:MAG: hypothetical protein AB1796_07895 [Bacillota bacterium]